jgi:cobalt transporter subunit CbtB
VDDPIGAKSVTAPATVSGEVSSTIGHWATGKARAKPKTRKSGDLPRNAGAYCPMNVSVARRVSMTARTNTVSLSISQRIAAGLVCVFIGVTLIFAVGLSQMAAAHNAAHDTRHSLGFPCH